MKIPKFPTQVKDHAVSQETFELHYNIDLELLETHPQPSKEELPKYYKSEDYISHTDSKRNWFEQLYHWARRFNLKGKLKLISSFQVQDKKLLDIGCGTGDFLLTAQQNGWKVCGVEPNVSARQIAQKKVNQCVFGTEQLNQFDAHSFDVITLWHVLEHLPNLQEEIKRLKKLLKPNGKLVIAVPNFKSFDAAYYKSYWAAYDVPRHLWHFSQTSMSKIFEAHQFTIEKTYPMKMDAYYVSLLSEKYKSGWMNFFNAFFVASRSNLKALSTGEYSSLIYVIKNV